MQEGCSSNIFSISTPPPPRYILRVDLQPASQGRPSPIENKILLMKYPLLPRALLLLAFSAPAWAAEKEPAAIIAKLEKGGDTVRLTRELAELGPGALDTIREKIRSGPSPVTKFLEQARNSIVAGQVSTALRKGLASQLSFDGQYHELGKNRAENIEALFYLLNDESSPLTIRLTSCRALADISNKSILPRLRQLYWDLLLDSRLREELGIILAIFGDTQSVEKELGRYEQFAHHQRSLVRLSANVQLSNIYYRIRDYEKAVEAYEKIIELSERIFKAESQAGIPKELLDARKEQLNLHYYNAACSNSLNGSLERARKYLLKAVQGNPEHYGNISKDGDLLKMRKDPGFPAFMKKLGRLFEDEEI
ncbi:MAG TPA: hypothetical protein DD471_15305 [Planctomycetes bacterium]|jgi:tetratricopeptide (TPR) repeat protein|nr:hypothetical protein [Planctomycetota bacterium]